MNIATKACLSLGSVSVIAAGYFAGTKLRGENNYECANSEIDDPENFYISINKQIVAPYKVDDVDGAMDTGNSISSNVIALDEKFEETTSNGVLVHSGTSKLGASDGELDSPPVLVTNVKSTPTKSVAEIVVNSGDTFISLAKASGVKTSDLTNLLYGSGISQKQFILTKGIVIKFLFTDGFLDEVLFMNDSIEYTALKKNLKGKFIKSIEKMPTSLSLVSKRIEIQSSLSADGFKADLTPSDIAQVEAALRSKVDFSTLPLGSVIKIVFEQETGNGKLLSSKVKAIRVTHGGGTTNAYHYKGKDGTGFYDEDGVSLTPSFLRHPIKNPLITSRFNLKRKHPILNVTRPHWGTDYGHIKGTPIYAISDAVVKFAGNRGNFGNTVILKHPQGIETLSAHMSKFARGIKSGGKVKKGEVIGYVGKTGLSTGYHLHFELKKNGKRVDSLKVDLPTVDKVDDISKFKREISIHNEMLK